MPICDKWRDIKVKAKKIKEVEQIKEIEIIKETTKMPNANK